MGAYLSMSGRGEGGVGACSNKYGMFGFLNSISLYYEVAYSLGKIVLRNEVVGSMQGLIVISYFRLQSVGS